MPGSPRRAADRAAAVTVVLASALAVLPILGNGFAWDDEAFFLRNGGFRSFDPRHLRWMFTTYHMGQYRPLSWLFWAALYRAFGLQAWAFHLGSLALHAACALAVFLLARAVFEAARAFEPGPGRAAALFAALFFGLHPLRVESVAWASNAHALLADLLFLLAALAYLRRRPRAALALQALSLLSKATAVSLPLVLLALDAYPLRRLAWPPRRKTLVLLLKEKLPFLALSATGAAAAIWAQRAAANFAPLSAYGAGARAAQTVYSLGFYLAKTACPLGLSPLYPLRALSFFDGGVLASAAVLAAAVWALRAAGAPREARAALWLAYVAILLPVLGPAQNGAQLVALRYSYLACTGWALALGAGAVRAAGRAPRAAAVAGLLLASSFLAADWSLAARWRDDAALWSWAAGREPGSPLAAANLCSASARAAAPEAVARCLKAAELEPASAGVRENLGAALAAAGRLEEAEAAFLEAARLEPSDAGIAENLARVRRERAAAQALRRPLKE